MSRRAKIVGGMTFLLLLLLLVAGSLAQAERSEGSLSGVSGLAAPTPMPELEESYLIWLQLPDEECPECLRPGATRGFYMEQLRAAQRPVLGTLARLKSEGLVSDFRPLLGAIQVDGVDPRALSILATLPGVFQITPAGAEEVAAARQEAEKVMRQGARETEREVAAQGEVSVLSTNPSVRVDETYDDVYGYTNAYASVTVVLKTAGGAVKDTQYTTADDGYYWVSFWDVGIGPGDRVQVTAIGNTVTVIVAALTGHVNVDTDAVWGTGPASSSIWVRVYGRVGCDWQYTDWVWTMTDGAGNYSVDFSALIDIVRGMYATVWYYHPDWNATIITRYAHIVQVDLTWSMVYGATDPYASVSAALKDSGGSIKDTNSTTAERDGWYYLWLWDMQVGDRVEVTTAGQTHTVYIKNLTVRVNSDTNVVSGEGPEASVDLVVWAYHFSLTSGWYYWYCAITTTGSSLPYPYSVDFSAMVDLIPGDYAGTQYTDENGNKLSTRGYAHIVYVENGGNTVWGYVDGGVPVTVTVKDAGDVTKAVDSMTSYSWGYYGFSLFSGGNPVEIVTGDTVYVTASPPITVPVVTLTATLDSGADTLSGTAPPNSDLYMYAYHYESAYGYYYEYYQYTTASGGGAYSVDYSGSVDLVTGDFAQVYYMNPEGNRVYTNAYTTSPTVTVTSHPSLFAEGVPGTVEWFIADGVRVDYTYLQWDTVSHPDDNYYWYGAWPYPYSGGMGTYSAQVWGPSYPNTVYFRVYANIDGRPMWTIEYSVPVTEAKKIYLPLIMKRY